MHKTVQRTKRRCCTERTAQGNRIRLTPREARPTGQKEMMTFLNEKYVKLEAGLSTELLMCFNDPRMNTTGNLI